ncbi:TetR/AcrR family transcriptional regulator [Mycolicibacterium sp. 018/SC-01/001]|uniref:TetR/AcrR family transcriptional regulator n=1 Tax=Mycolicibacterium sp. 018/SC-01/001 TaxID=2592069 RepID=UPI00117EADA2|nr:TetR/AcrR family transcriptional regulator [Mycolicibacterium sp. 018/SC-01/001]TRW87955.1 TetR/AcrR family transcriptional regulator [Mycolicibacterium sp. 018/SC-01/001]
MASVQATSGDVGGTGRRPRVRNPELHRAAILAAARAVFGEVGYANGTIREIARRAGVTHGLIFRHFASKEELFVTALLARREEQSYSGTVADLPEWIARRYVDNIETDGPSDPFIALIRSASDTGVAKELLNAMRREPTLSVLGALDVSDLPKRADLLGALLTGVTFNRYILADGELAAMSARELIAYLTTAIHTILFGPLHAASDCS